MCAPLARRDKYLTKLLVKSKPPSINNRLLSIIYGNILVLSSNWTTRWYWNQKTKPNDLYACFLWLMDNCKLKRFYLNNLIKIFLEYKIIAFKNVHWGFLLLMNVYNFSFLVFFLFYCCYITLHFGTLDTCHITKINEKHVILFYGYMWFLCVEQISHNQLGEWDIYIAHLTEFSFLARES